MRKKLFQIILFLIALNSSAQTDSIYTDINQALKSPSNVFRLNLSFNQKINKHLKYLDQFVNLTQLNLNYCDLDNLPLSVLDCSELKTLKLSGNNLSKIPESLLLLSNLEELDLSKNRIKELPKTIGNFKKLTRLDVSANYKLLEIPITVKNLEALEFLSCSATNDEVKNIISHLPNLIELEIYSNSINVICSITTLKQLTSFKLVLSESEIEPFKCSLKELTQLKKVRLETRNCCWPYVTADKESENAMKNLLPEGCILSGVRPSEEIKSDIELR